MIIPADSILISGSCFINEVSITGDSVSVLKEPLEPQGKLFNIQTDLQNIILDGTKVMLCKPS